MNGSNNGNTCVAVELAFLKVVAACTFLRIDLELSWACACILCTCTAGTTGKIHAARCPDDILFSLSRMEVYSKPVVEKPMQSIYDPSKSCVKASARTSEEPGTAICPRFLSIHTLNQKTTPGKSVATQSHHQSRTLTLRPLKCRWPIPARYRTSAAAPRGLAA